MTKTNQTAIVLPKELIKLIDAERAIGETRSSWIRSAINNELKKKVVLDGNSTINNTKQ